MTLAYTQEAYNLVCSARTPGPLISQGIIDYLHGTATQGILASTGRGKPQGLSHLCLTSLGLPDKSFLFPSRSLILIFPLGLLKNNNNKKLLCPFGFISHSLPYTNHLFHARPGNHSFTLGSNSFLLQKMILQPLKTTTNHSSHLTGELFLTSIIHRPAERHMRKLSLPLSVCASLVLLPQ